MKRFLLFSIIVLLLIGQTIKSRTPDLLIGGEEDLIEIHIAKPTNEG